MDVDGDTKLAMSTSFRQIDQEPSALKLNEPNQRAALMRQESICFKERLKDMKNLVAAKDIELWSIKTEMDTQAEDARATRRELETQRAALKQTGTSNTMLRTMSQTENPSVSLNRSSSKGVRFESAEKNSSFVRRNNSEIFTGLSKPSWKDRSIQSPMISGRDPIERQVDDFLNDHLGFVQTESNKSQTDFNVLDKYKIFVVDKNYEVDNQNLSSLRDKAENDIGRDILSEKVGALKEDMRAVIDANQNLKKDFEFAVWKTVRTELDRQSVRQTSSNELSTEQKLIETLAERNKLLGSQLNLAQG